MESEILQIVSSLGLGIGLVLWYVLVQVPRQEEREKIQNQRYDALIDRIVDANKECSNRMEEALHELRDAIKENRI